MVVGSSYFLIFINVFIFSLFLYQYFLRKELFIRYFLIGKFLQILFSVVVEFCQHLSDSMFYADFLLVAGIPFEIYGILSYNGHYSRKSRNILLIFLLVSLVSLVLIRNTGSVKHRILSVSIFIYYLYGAYVLKTIKDASKFRVFIGIVFFIYALLHLSKLLFFNAFPEPGLFEAQIHQLPAPGQEMPPPDQMHGNLNPIFEIAVSDMIFFVSIISGFGLLILLKEQDEIKLAELNEKISSENTNLVELDKERNKFFSIIAHDLKGPLGTVSSISELLLSRKDKLQREDYEKWMEHINVSLNRVLLLLNNLLYWARSQSGMMVAKPELVSVEKLINEVIELLGDRAKSKGITIINSCSDGIVVYVDKEMLSTSIRNVVSNAIKFSGADGKIILDAHPQKNNTIEISIRDNGVGMNQKTLDSLFKLDSNISTPGTNDEEGSGLGLKLVHEFVEKNNGQIQVESKEGVGSIFYITLPSSGSGSKEVTE